MNSNLSHSARSIFQHQLTYGSEVRGTLEAIRNELRGDAIGEVTVAVTVPLFVGATILTVFSAGALAPTLAVPAAVFARGIKSAKKALPERAGDVQTASSIDVRFGAMGRLPDEARQALVAHLVDRKVLARPEYRLALDVVYLRHTHDLKSVLQEHAPFVALAADAQHDITTYLLQVHQMAPMVRVVRDLEAKLAQAIAHKDAALTGIVSTKLVAFKEAIGAQLSAMDTQALADSAAKGLDLIAF